MNCPIAQFCGQTVLTLAFIGQLLLTCQPCAADDSPKAPSRLVAPFAPREIREARQAWAKYRDCSSEFINEIDMQLAFIPPGEFVMGSPEDEDQRRDHEQQRRVIISQPFYLATTEVTQGQWKTLVKSAPWEEKRFVREEPTCAASYVNWDDAVEFCRRLSKLEERTYRLPTEAEWEYACRAGTSSAYSFGDDDSAAQQYAWISANAFDIEQKYAHPVRAKRANQFGLHDMHGNNWEWCGDWFLEAFEEGNGKPIVDPVGPSEGVRRVIRGGSWHGAAHLCRSANRFYRRPEMRTSDVGFRVVMELDD